MSKCNPCHIVQVIACLCGLTNLRADSSSWQTLSLQHGLDSSLPQAKEPTSNLGEADVVKKVGIVMKFEEIIPLALSDGHLAYITIMIDAPADFRRDIPFLAGSGGSTSTMRDVQTIRFLARTNFPPAFPPWNEYWATIRAVARH